MKSIFTCALLLLLTQVNAFSAEKVYTSKSIFKHFKQAVVHISVYQQNVVVGTGTGFFINNKGDLATNVHVMRDVLTTAGATAKFRTSDGKLISNYTIGKCSDERRIDLCVLRLKHKPKVWIPLDKSKPEVGTTVYAIGHPRGYNFSISKGIISGYRDVGARLRVYDKKTSKTINQVQVSTPVSPGNSGGPIISENGKLVGVIQWGRSDKGSQNLNFGITKSELVQHYKSIKEFITPSQRMRRETKLTLASVKKYTDKYLEPIWDYLIKSGKAKKFVSKYPKYFNSFEFKGFENKYTIDLFNITSKDCKLIKKTKLLLKHHCKDKRSGFYITIERSKTEFDIAKIFNGHTPKPFPLGLLAAVKKESSWPTLKKTLTKKNIKFLSQFHTKPYKCKTKKVDIIGRPRVLKECATNIYNYGALNATAKRYQFQFGNTKEMVTLTSYADEADYSGVSLEAGALASLTIRKTSIKKRVKRGIASSKMTVAQHIQKTKKKNNSIDLDSLRYKCSIKNQMKPCGELFLQILTQSDKKITTAQNTELNSVSKRICESTAKTNGYYCYIYGMNTKQVPYLIKSCKQGYKKACSTRIPSSN